MYWRQALSFPKYLSARDHGLASACQLAALQPNGSLSGCCWGCRSNHLVGYGAQYYCYLYAKCFAASAWQQYMAEDPFDPSAGKPCSETKSDM